MKHFLILSLRIVVSCALVALATLLVCDWLVCHNAKNRLFTEVSEVPAHETGLLLGTPPLTRLGHRHNQFFTTRLDAAEALFKAGKIQRLLISGDEHSLDGINEVTCMRDSLVKRGIPAECILLDGKGFRTLDSVVRASRKYGLKSFVIISQRFHDERALYQADHLDLDLHDVVAYVAANPTSKMAIMIYVREYFARVKLFLDLLTDKQPTTLD